MADEREPLAAARGWTGHRVIAASWGLALAGALAGCDGLVSEPERDPLDVPLDEIVELTRTGSGPLLADGRSEDTVVVRLPDHAFPRKVTFRTTAGTFLDARGREQIVTAARVAGEERLVARAVLVAGTAPDTAAVSATVGDFTRYLAVPMTRP